MNIIIVAGGLGTRFDELSVFPKILLPTKKYNSLLEQNRDIFQYNGNNKIYLIINEKYYNMTINYCQVNNIDIEIIKSTNTNGSYNTILSVYDKIPHEDILFIWSDLELNSYIIKEFYRDTIVTYQGNYRYGIENGIITHHENYDGNIPGIYYIKNLSLYLKYNLDEKNNYDFVEILQEVGNIDSIEFEGIIEEYKDKKTYIKNIKDIPKTKFSVNLKTRFFNLLEPDYINKDIPVIKKRAIDKDYFHLIQKEYDWYQNLKKQDFGEYKYDMIVPKIYDGMIENNTGFVMEFLDDYIPLHHYIKTHEESDVQKIYETIHLYLNILSKCTEEVDDFVFYKDLEKEIITKVVDRCEKIKYMLINYDKKSLSVLLDRAYEYLCNNTKIINHKIQYCVCHGDLNGSNILVNPTTKDVKFLDPRGYFGYTTFYGWQDYEYSKLLYCLSGYDDFNNLPQIYGMDEPIKLEWFDKIDYLNKPKYKVILGVIWIALAGYISQDIMKANIAYEYGMQMLQDILDGNE